MSTSGIRLVLSLVVGWMGMAGPVRGDYLWVPNFGDDTVSRVDLSLRQVDAVIRVGRGPGGIAVGRDLVVVAHRWSPVIYRISKTTGTVVDSVDLSPYMAFSIAVAQDAAGRSYVIGRKHMHAPETDMAVLAKLEADGQVSASTDLVAIQGDGADPLSPFHDVGIAVSGAGLAYVPWARSWDSHTGILLVDLTSLSSTNIAFDPFSFGYLGAGVGVDSSGGGWCAASRPPARRIINIRPDGTWDAGPLECPVVARRDVSIAPDGSVWISFDVSETSLGHWTNGNWACIPPASSFPCGLGHGNDGLFWATFPSEGTVRSYAQTGEEIGGAIAVGSIPLGYGDMTGAELWLGAPTVGACCLMQYCLICEEPECAQYGGDYLGIGTTCDPNPCLTGACCLGMLSCRVCRALDCAEDGGTYLGDGTSCYPNPCPTSAASDAVTPHELQIVATPTPSAGPVSIRYALPSAGPVSLDVFDASGSRVRCLRSGVESAGEHSALWDRCDDAGHEVSSGVYLVRMRTADGERRARVVVIG